MPGCKHRHLILSPYHTDSASADTPDDGDYFVYDDATKLWTPKAHAHGASIAHGDLDDLDQDHHALYLLAAEIAQLITDHTAISEAHHEIPEGDGGIDHAYIGALFPGVLSTGVKPPQVPYVGDSFTATVLYCRVSVAPQTSDIIVSMRLNGVEIDTVTIASGNNAGAAVVSQAIVGGNYFDINITQVGTNPNQGSDLVWLLAP